MRRSTQPAVIGFPFSGATTNQLASTGPRTPKLKPRSSSGQRGSVSAIAANSRPHSLPQNIWLTMVGTP
jgi:hypothetical protein